MYDNKLPSNVRTLESTFTDLEKGSKKIELSPERIGFIRKVLGIVGCQLILSAILCIYSMINLKFTIFLLDSNLFIFAPIIGIILYLILVCNKRLQREYPTNYIFLAGITICESVIPAILCGFIDPSIVSQAFFITAGIVSVLFCFAYHTDTDFTTNKQVRIILITLPILCLISSLFLDSDLEILIYCGLGALFYGIYLIVDLQLILGRIENGNKLTYDDYIIASVEIYFDIIRLFVKILQILNSLKNSRK